MTTTPPPRSHQQQQAVDRFAEALAHRNVRAFLYVVRLGESHPTDPEAFRALFGWSPGNGKTFSSFADHPRVRTYEKYDGQFVKNGKLDYTTAAGAFQIVESTWDPLNRRCAFGDFSPQSQELAAVALIDEHGALADVIAGRLEVALRKVAREWASLPFSPWGQPRKTLEQCVRAYLDAGGMLEGSAPPAPAAPAPAPPRDLTPPAPPPLAPMYGESWDPLATVASPPAPQPAPAPPASTEEPPPMVAPPIIAAAAPALIRELAGVLFGVFEPLAKEKVAKEIGRHTANPAVADQVAQAAVDAAKRLTGQADPVAAVAAARADPAAVQAVQADVLGHLDRLAPVLERAAAWERESWSAEEASRQAASARAAAETGPDQDPYLTRSIVWLLVGVLAGGAVLIGVLAWLKVDVGQLVGALILLVGIVGSEFRGRMQHRYGSSRGSAAKDALLDELARRPRA